MVIYVLGSERLSTFPFFFFANSSLKLLDGAARLIFSTIWNRYTTQILPWLVPSYHLIPESYEIKSFGSYWDQTQVTCVVSSTSNRFIHYAIASLV